MSKRAEEAALKAYPKEVGKMYSTAFGTFEFDRNAAERKGFQEGYERAEKDVKDALLEWINETRAIPHENAITRDLAFQEVVNKLNEL